MNTDRFLCASSGLSLRELLKQGRKVLLAGLGLTTVVHFSLTQITGLREEEQAIKPLTTQFVKRQPRLTKPLEMKKRPRPKRRPLQRKMVSLKAKMQRGQRSVRFQPKQVLRGLARPSIEIRRAAAFGSVGMEPRSIAQIIEGTKEAEQKIDMSLELLDIKALDTGKHHAMVLVDPTDKRNIRGFLHLASAYPVGSFPKSEERWWPMIIGPLIAAMNQYTDIRTDCGGKYSLDSGELLKMPWLYTRHYLGGFRVTESEAASLGEYLLLGGFIFAEGTPPGAEPWTPDASLREMVKDALRTQDMEFGKAWTFDKLPNSHPIYHCYFDFDGPPIGSDSLDYWPSVPYLEGVEVHGRMVLLLSDKNYAYNWVVGDARSEYGYIDSTRQLQFGVNSIIFALTQEGSITHQLMESIK